ncbi:hypothetical protein A3G06_00050 [Candidatus Nomurabacteria bacterium RIFCSPLOWO2_12_FULL_46_14]|uniref:Uncharacterized protein n=1 Tax=Candidatus Nomurabacteria bacterium RIFCSPLOWO2_12_FULL_46_14 TaxID=1801797 RepID=A0A1F6YCK9_9BACT|nr:MAG: hypothetical protein A3G06_00050 [Candidatus Nomurabacteria bacterium RIFCSPLOWO2_12_FULL_46_14]
MPHLSKRKLNLEHLRELERELVHSLERSFLKTKTRFVFNEFFTKTERIMFAKRLAVIAMLQKGISSYMIAEALFMSPSTTERMLLAYEQDKYQNIIKEALGKKDIWNIIESILNMGGILPPRYGGGRWRTIDKHIYKKNLKDS